MSRRDLIDQRIDDLPIAILDFETTGLSPKAGARVVEVAAVRVEPGQAPCLVLDTLVDPEGPVHCTSIHGIDDDHVVGAPRFGQATHLIVQALSDAMVGSFNASFDMAFLEAEARKAHPAPVLERPPHVCLMWLRPLLKIGRRCSLEQACSHFGLPSGTHRAADDAMVSAHLWRCYISAAKKLDVTRVRDLRNLGTHRYLESFDSSPYSRELAALSRSTRVTLRFS